MVTLSEWRALWIWNQSHSAPPRPHSGPRVTSSELGTAVACRGSWKGEERSLWEADSSTQFKQSRAGIRGLAVSPPPPPKGSYLTGSLRSLGFSCFLLKTAIQNTPRPPSRGVWGSSPIESNPPSLCKVFQQWLNTRGCELLSFYVSIPHSKVWFCFVLFFRVFVWSLYPRHLECSKSKHTTSAGKWA